MGVADAGPGLPEFGRGKGGEPGGIRAAPGADLGDDGEIVGIRVQRLADEALAAMPDRMEEVESSYRGWLDALDASLDASEAALSDAEAQRPTARKAARQAM